MESATLLATFLLAARGTPFIYQGEEIGMTNDDFQRLDDLDDPMTIGAIQDLLEAGRADSYEELLADQAVDGLDEYLPETDSEVHPVDEQRPPASIS